MAIEVKDVKRKVLQNLRTKKDDEFIKSSLSGTSALGEIVVQYPDEDGSVASGTSLWTLAQDGETAVKFVNEDTVKYMIEHGAVEEVDKIEESVGLNMDGSIIDASGNSAWVSDESPYEAPNYISSGATIIEGIKTLDNLIHDMNKESSSADGKVVITVTQEDGLVDEEKIDVKDLQLGGYLRDETKIGDIGSGDTINEALSKIENAIEKNTVSNTDGSINVISSTSGTDINVNIKEGEKVIKKDGNNGIYTDLDIVKVTSGIPSDVREVYRLLSSGEQIGEDIEIYKDSSLESVGIGHVGDLLSGTTSIDQESDSPEVIPTTESGATETLNFVYLLKNGKYKLVQVDIESFLHEAEFKDGLQVINHEVSVKKDVNSGKVYVGDTKEVDVLTISKDGVKIANVQEAIDFAVNEEYERALSAETILAEAIEEEIAARKAVDGQSGQTYSPNSNANYINDVDSLNAADVKLDAILGKVENDPDSADTIFDTTNTVAQNITNIKKDIEAFKKKLTLSGLENEYAKVTIVSGESGTTIEVSAKTTDIKTSSAITQGLADAFDVKEFAINGIYEDSTEPGVVAYDKSAGVVVTEDENDDNVRKLDFSHLVVDCGVF